MVFAHRPNIETHAVRRHFERRISRDVQEFEDRFLNNETKTIADGGQMLGDGKTPWRVRPHPRRTRLKQMYNEHETYLSVYSQIVYFARKC